MARRTPEPERFWPKVVESEAGCWLWLGDTDRDGYGRFTVYPKRVVRAHRWVYEQLRADIPEGLVIDHLCRVRNCVNPDHMEPVPSGVNAKRGHGADGRTTCRNGHPWTAASTYVLKNKRYCRVCSCDSSRRYAARKKAEAAA